MFAGRESGHEQRLGKVLDGPLPVKIVLRLDRLAVHGHRLGRVHHFKAEEVVPPDVTALAKD